MPDAASKPRGVKPHRAIVASTCVALVILAGLLLWQPWANIDATPMTDPEPGAADSGQLAGEGLTDLLSVTAYGWGSDPPNYTIDGKL